MALLPFLAAVLGGATVIFLTMAISTLISRSEVQDRLLTYGGDSPLLGPEAESEPGLADRANAYISQRGFADGIALSLVRAGVSITVPEFIMLKIAAASIPFIIAAVFGRLFLAILLAALCSIIPDLWIRRRERRRRRDFVAQLPDTLALLVSGLRAGFSLQQAMKNVSQEAPEPTASAFQRVTKEIQLGVPLIQALEGLSQRIQSDDLEMIVSVFKIHGRVGGNLAQVLDNVAFTIRERVKLKREVQVITSMQRISANVLGALPWAVGGVIFVLNPKYMLEIFSWNIFLCLPIMAFVMGISGYLIIRRMANIEV